MINGMFLRLFPEERDLAEAVITEVRKREGLLKKEDRFTPYQERFGNLYDTLKQIHEDHPDRVREVLTEITQGYDGFVDEAVARFSLTTDAYWQNYRRNQLKGSMTVFPVESKSDEENDRALAENYKTLLTVTAEAMDRPIVPLDTEPQFQLLDRRAERALGIGIYIFKNGTGHPIETVWDFRRTEVPRFQYNDRE
jgi:hypothetical protein